jgi:uncharacterized protein (DUF983 family)
MADSSLQTGPTSDRLPVSGWRKIWAMLRQRCPRCGKGKIFTGILKMNDPCPVCGLIFQREEGYFLGAMYFSYLLGAMFLGAAYLLALILLPDWNWYLLLAIVLVPYVLLTPVFFRYSRTIWIYYERWSCPSDASAGAYEKARAKEFAERNPTHSPK